MQRLAQLHQLAFHQGASTLHCCCAQRLGRLAVQSETAVRAASDEQQLVLLLVVMMLFWL